MHVPTNPNAGICDNSGIKCVTFKLRYKIVRATIQSSYFSRRDTEQKKDEPKKPDTPAYQPDNKRSRRDVTETTASPDAKKDEKHE